MGRRVVLQDHLAKLAERGIEIEAPDGQIFKVPPPDLWPDSVTASSSIEADAVALLGGQERFDAFVAAGGSARLLDSIIRDGFEADVPES